MTVLRSSLSQQLNCWLQLCYPSNMFAAAERMDSVHWKVLHVPSEELKRTLSGDVCLKKERGL